MLTVHECNERLERAIRELAAHIVAPRMGQFESLWEAANRVCDRYRLPAPENKLEPAA